MELKEYAKAVKKQINDIKMSAYLTRAATKKRLEIGWRSKLSPSYMAAVIKKEYNGK